MKYLKYMKGHFPCVLRFKELKSLLVLVTCFLLIMGGFSMLWAQEETDMVFIEEEERGLVEQAGLGVASALLTIPYGSVKIAYAGLGGIVGGATWLLTGGNARTAQSVWEPSFYGDYVITPEHLTGGKPLRFFGASAYKEDPYAE